MPARLGERIRVLRLKKGYTQNSLAVRLCVSKQAVSKWENDISYPDIFLLPRLAKLLSITLDDLFSETVFEEEEDGACKRQRRSAQMKPTNGGNLYDII